jgi:hypothetical protein
LRIGKLAKITRQKDGLPAYLQLDGPSLAGDLLRTLSQNEGTIY